MDIRKYILLFFDGLRKPKEEEIYFYNGIVIEKQSET